MPLSSPQSNKLLTGEQIVLMREAITSRREILQHVNKLMKDEEAKSAAYIAAIAQLEPAISRAKHTLMAKRQAVVDLTKVKVSLEQVKGIPSCYNDGTSRVKELCEKTMAYADTQITDNIGKLTKHIYLLEEIILTLSSGLAAMELEVHSQSIMLGASAQYISQMDEFGGKMRENMGLLKSAINPIKNIPAEIWTRIFTLRVNEDMETYFANPQGQLIPPTAFKLSHVCQIWRRVVLSERVLWQFMTIYPDSQWLPSKIELLKKSRSNYPGIPTLVYELTGAIIWSGTTHTCNPCINATRAPIAIGANEVSLFNEYSLRLLTYGYNSGAVLPSSTSFCKPRSVTMEIIGAAQAPYLNQVLGALSTFARLELVTKQMYPSIVLPLSSSHSQLTYLKLDLTTFQPFSIASYLGPNLEELYIHHNGENSLTLDTASLRLAKLKVLGVTPPDTNFTESLVLPKLDKIIFYGPKSTSIDRISLGAFASGKHFIQARELELRNWPPFKSNAGEEWSVMSIMGDVVDRMHRIATLKCVDGNVEGSRLVGIIEKLKDTSSKSASVLETVVIDCCSGVTRDNCEAIGDLVGKVEVYV